MFSLFFLRILTDRMYRFLDNNVLFHPLALVTKTLYFKIHIFNVFARRTEMKHRKEWLRCKISIYMKT